MQSDQLVRTTRKAEEVLPKQIARSWKCFALLLGSYASSRQVSSVYPITAEKLFALFLLYRSDANLAYRREYRPDGPVCWGRVTLRQGTEKATSISEHVRFHCQLSKPSYLTLQDDEFVPKVTEQHIREWKQQELIDEDLVDDAEHLGWSLGKLDTAQILHLANASSTPFVLENIQRNVLHGHSKLRGLRELRKPNLETLRMHVRDASEYFSAGVELIKAHEVVPQIQGTLVELRERLQALGGIQKYEYAVARLVELIVIAPSDAAFRRVAWTCRVLGWYCELAQHLLDLASATNDKCTDPALCSVVQGLATSIDGARADGLFNNRLLDFSSEFESLHSKWIISGSTPFDDIDTYSQDFNYYAAKLTTWLNL